MPLTTLSSVANGSPASITTIRKIEAGLGIEAEEFFPGLRPSPEEVAS
jgi:hypothetical protein